MNKELNLFRQLVITVFEHHIGAYDTPSKSVRAILEGIPYQYSRFSDSSALGNYLPTDAQPIADFKAAPKFLYLRPIEKGTPTIPVVSLKSDFRRSLPEIRIRLALFVLGSGGETQALGYRYETPEGPGNGRHDYYHVQPIRVLHRDKPGFQLSTPDWFPDSHPAWPIDAKDSIGLLLTLLFSLYGLDFYEELAAYRMALTLKNHMLQTHCLNLPRPSLWKVICAGKEFHYATWYDKNAFDRSCTEAHPPKCRKEPLTSAEYNSLPQNRQLIR